MISAARNIQNKVTGNADSVDGNLNLDGHNQIAVSTSPTDTFNRSYASSYGMAGMGGVPTRRMSTGRATTKQLKPFATEDIKILLLENVNNTGRDALEKQGYQVEAYKGSLAEEELIAKIRDVHVIGIRSKTKLTARVLREAKNLIVIGCFCIGTNQVDLQYAAGHGIAVFNSPFSNSRSVAELVIAEVVVLARQLGDRSSEMRQGIWNKVNDGCWEVRGKTLGIVGYGHIGSQLSVMAEAMGMSVIYYDVEKKLNLGSARRCDSLHKMLREADFVTLHVPEIADTTNMMGEAEFAAMRKGSYLLNNARGKIVDIPALIEAMRTGHLAGAAIDVFPHEPAGNGEYFKNDLNTWAEDLRGLKNVILTPHIGGSTEEAQSAIGIEVSASLIQYINQGTTVGAVNMPEVNLRSLTMDEPNHVRVIYIHKNRPGVLKKVNEILGDHNVDKQMTDSRGEVAYLMADISDVQQQDIKELYESLESQSSRIMTRVLY